MSLTRRRLAALTAIFFIAPRLRAAKAADLPTCMMSQDLDNWQLSAWYDEDATEPGYSLTLRKGTIPLPNRSDSLKLTIFDMGYDVQAHDMLVNCDASWPDGVKSADPVEYQLVNNGAALAAFNLSPDRNSQALHVGLATIDRLAKNDSVVRVTLAGQNYQVTVSAQSFREALVTAQALAKRVKAEHDRKACSEVKSGGCVLTTVACETVGLPDDCFELRIIRRLRDQWIARQAFGPAALEWYYAIAPVILHAMPHQSHARVFRRFYVLRVLPGVIAECLGCHACAYRWLRAGVERLALKYGATAGDAASPR